MINLGRIGLAHDASIPEVRRKVSQVAEAIVNDPVDATRIATAISTAARQLLQTQPTAWIDLRIISAAPSRLEVVFAGDGEPPNFDRLAGFFDGALPVSRSGDAWNQIHAVDLQLEAPLPNSRIDELRSIVSQKSRDELVAEIQATNRELQESLENLKRTTTAKQRMESELNIGRDIQMSMLPVTFPAFPERLDFDVHATLVPAREVGGDFYDLFLIDEHHFCFCVGDVSGKGVPSALFMAVTKTLIKSRAANDLSPASILSHVNTELSHHNESCMFVTIFLAILDLQAGRMSYTNAGHNPPYLLRAGQEPRRLDRRHGPIVGAQPGLAYREDAEALEPGDRVFLYTDGVTEAMDPAENLYTETRLAELLAALPADSPAAAVRGAVDDVWKFQADADQADDVTVMVVSFQGADRDEVHRVELTITNQLDQIERVQGAFQEFAQRHAVAEAIRRRVNLVFDELLNNIISYAYSDDDEHMIEVVLTIVDDTIVVRLTDDGRAYNPFETTEPDTSLSVSDRPIGGLGVHLVRNVMDEVRYERHGARNVVTLSKRLADEP